MPTRSLARRSGAFALLAVLAAILLPAPAQSHPHIWIKAQATLQMEGGKVVAVTQEWTFDAFFSAALIKDFDKEKDAKLSPEEIASMRQNAFSALKDFDYFTHVRVDGKKQKLGDVKDFSARIADGRVVYRFTIALPEPVDPRRAKAAFLFYDHTYYVDVALEGGSSVALVNGGSCRVALIDDKANPIYFGMVVPKMATLVCADG